MHHFSEPTQKCREISKEKIPEEEIAQKAREKDAGEEGAKT